MPESTSNSPTNRGANRLNPLYKRLGKEKLQRALELCDEMSEIGVNMHGLASEIESCIHSEGVNPPATSLVTGPASTFASGGPKPPGGPRGSEQAPRSPQPLPVPSTPPPKTEMSWLPATTRAAIGDQMAKVIEDLIDHLAAQSFRKGGSTKSHSINLSLRVNPNLHPHQASSPYALIRDWARDKDWETTGPTAKGGETVAQSVKKSIKAHMKNRAPCISDSIEGNTALEVACKTIQRVGRGRRVRKQVSHIRESRMSVNTKQALGQLYTIVEEMQTLTNEILLLSQIGSPSDDDLRSLDTKKHAYDDKKYQLSDVLSSLPEDFRLPAPEEKHPLLQRFLSTLLYEGDQREGSKECVKALINHVDADFGKVIEEECLVATQCGDGNIDFFRILVQSDVCTDRFDKADVIVAACYSQTGRIPLMLAALEYIDISPVINEIDDTMQEFFEDITSSARAIPKEERVGVHQLIRTMLAHSEIKIDFETIDAAGNTIFARCCAEGDALLYDIISIHSPQAVQPTKLLCNNMTPLHLAVFYGHPTLVGLLLEAQGCDPDVVGNGTPLGVAQAMQRKSCEELLRTAGAKKVVLPETD